MTPEKWQHAVLLFEKALELKGEERARFLEQLAAEDPEVAMEVRKLLRGDEQQTWSLEERFASARALFEQHLQQFAPGAIILGRFRIGRLLGRGGMGEVYEATDLELGPIALKTIRPDVAGNPDMLALFRREVHLARQISSPHVCRIHELFTLPDEAGQPVSAFLTMELLEGGTLADRIRARERLPWREAHQIALGICDGLQAIHQAGVIHRDLKSRNVMLAMRNGAPQPIIMDFGLAWREASIPAAQLGSAPAGPQVVIGTPESMAPEQFASEPVTPATDIYALGVVLYEMVTGVRPFAASSTLGAAIRRAKRPVPASSIQKGLPKRWDRAIERCLAFEPKDRFQSAIEVAEALQPKAYSIRAHPRIAAALFAAMAAVLTLCLVWLQQHRYRTPPAQALRWYQAGVAALREGTYLKAANALKQALANDSTFALAHARLADTFNELDYYGEAKDELLEATGTAISQDLPKLDQQYIDAIRATVLHDFAAALRDYRLILQSLDAAQKADGYIDLGRAYEKTGDLTHAVESYTEATTLAPDYPAAFVRIGVLEGRQNHIAKSDAAFATAEKLYHASSNYEGLAEIQYSRGEIAAANLQPARARAFLTQALAFARENSPQLEARALCRLSAVEHAAEDDKAAEQLAQQARSLADAEGLPYWALEAQCRIASACAYQKGRLTEAERNAQQVLQSANRNRWPLLAAEAKMTLSIIHNQENHPAEALPLARDAIDYYRQAGYFTDSTRALIQLIRATRDRSDFQNALALCRQGLAIEEKSGSPPVMIQMEEAAGTVYLAVENYPEALVHFEAATNIARRNQSQLLDYEVVHVADTLWRMGEYGSAEQDLNTLTADMNKNGYLASSVNSVLAEMRLSQNQYREVIRDAERARALDPGDPLPDLDIFTSIADLELGSTREALRLAERALSGAEDESDEVLVAKAKIASAEVLLKNSPGHAKDLAQAAWETFSRLGEQESEWRAEALLARISIRLGDKNSARDQAAKSLEMLSALAQKWGKPVYQTYLQRPDVSAAVGNMRALTAQHA